MRVRNQWRDFIGFGCLWKKWLVSLLSIISYIFSVISHLVFFKAFDLQKTVSVSEKDLGVGCTESKECPDNSGCDTTDNTCKCDAAYYEATPNTCAESRLFFLPARAPSFCPSQPFIAY